MHLRPSCLLPALMLASAGVLCDAAFAQQTTPIADVNACGTCRISSSHVVTLRGADDIGLSTTTPVVRSGQSYVAAPTHAPGTLLVYDSAGSLKQRFGRAGAGPGEIQGTSYRVTVGPGDTVHVIDGAKWSVFRPGDFRFVRSFPVSELVTHAAVTPRGEPVISFQTFRPNGTVSYIAVLDPVSGNVSRTYEGPATAGNAAENVHVLHVDTEGVWTSPTGRELITLFRAGGGAQTWNRNAGWFPAGTIRSPGEPFYERPSPRIFDLRADIDLIWVFGAVADRNWQPRARPRSAELPRIMDADPNRVFDGIVEVVERRTGQVLARVLQDWVARPLPGARNLVRRAVALPDGDVEIVIMRLELVRR